MEELSTIFEKYLAKDDITLLPEGIIYRIEKNKIPENSQIVCNNVWRNIGKNSLYIYPSYIFLHSVLHNAKMTYDEFMRKLIDEFLNNVESFFSENKIIKLGIRYLPVFREIKWHYENNCKIIDIASIESCVFPVREGGKDFDYVYEKEIRKAEKLFNILWEKAKKHNDYLVEEWNELSSLLAKDYKGG
jgi:hypothetical protein